MDTRNTTFETSTVITTQLLNTIEQAIEVQIKNELLKKRTEEEEEEKEKEHTDTESADRSAVNLNGAREVIRALRNEFDEAKNDLNATPLKMATQAKEVAEKAAQLFKSVEKAFPDNNAIKQVQETLPSCLEYLDAGIAHEEARAKDELSETWDPFAVDDLVKSLQEQETRSTTAKATPSPYTEEELASLPPIDLPLPATPPNVDSNEDDEPADESDEDDEPADESDEEDGYDERPLTEAEKLAYLYENSSRPSSLPPVRITPMDIQSADFKNMEKVLKHYADKIQHYAEFTKKATFNKADQKNLDDLKTSTNAMEEKLVSYGLLLKKYVDYLNNTHNDPKTAEKYAKIIEQIRATYLPQLGTIQQQLDDMNYGREANDYAYYTNSGIQAQSVATRSEALGAKDAYFENPHVLQHQANSAGSAMTFESNLAKKTTAFTEEHQACLIPHETEIKPGTFARTALVQSTILNPPNATKLKSELYLDPNPLPTVTQALSKESRTWVFGLPPSSIPGKSVIVPVIQSIESHRAHSDGHIYVHGNSNHPEHLLISLLYLEHQKAQTKLTGAKYEYTQVSGPKIDVDSKIFKRQLAKFAETLKNQNDAGLFAVLGKNNVLAKNEQEVKKIIEGTTPKTR